MCQVTGSLKRLQELCWSIDRLRFNAGTVLHRQAPKAACNVSLLVQAKQLSDACNTLCNMLCCTDGATVLWYAQFSNSIQGAGAEDGMPHNIGMQAFPVSVVCFLKLYPPVGNCC